MQNVAPHLLENNRAQNAENCRLDNGELRAIRGMTDVSALAKAGTIQSLYRYQDSFWFHWTQVVDVVASQIPGDTEGRVYFTGDGVPKVTYASIATAGGTQEYPTNSFSNGVPKPTTVPAVSTTNSAPWFTISAIAGTNPPTASAAGCDYQTGDIVQIKDARFAGAGGTSVGQSVVNGTHTVTRVTIDAFTIDGVDGTNFDSYQSTSGQVRKVDNTSETDIVSRTYVWTWIATIGGAQIEGPPSDPTSVIDVGVGQYVSLTGFPTSPPAGYNITGKRLYRFEGDDISVGYRYVGDITLASASYADSVDVDDLGSANASDDFFPPPDDLHSLIALPNGVQAGLAGNQLCFCEPYEPHAWPTAYRHSMESDGVALGAIGNTVVVTTESVPYIAIGSDPRTMSMDKMETPYACVSKRGLVDMGYSIVYPGIDGLVSVKSGSIPSVITDGLISKIDWRALKPDSMHAYRWEDKYLAFYDTGSVQGGLILDPSGQQFAYIDTYATAGYTHQEDGFLYLVIDGAVVKWDADALSSLTYTWKSKAFDVPRKVSMQVARVWAWGYPVHLKIWGDGTLLHDADVADESEFVIADGLYQRWEFQVSGTNTVRQVEIAESIQELAAT